MEIIKSTPAHPRSCKFGDFELKPEEGWELSQTFIDFLSKLLIVTVTIKDQSKWIDSGYGTRTIPGKEYRIDLATLRILTTEEWRGHFNYDPVEIISDDKKYKLVRKRVYDADKDTDGFEEELYELSSDKLITKSQSIAFSETKRENLLESYCNSIREAERQKRILDAKPGLEEFYINQLNSLQNKENIICYFDDRNTFELSYIKSRFRLSASGKPPSAYRNWVAITFSTVEVYDSLDDFWSIFTRDEKWFMKFSPFDALSKKPLLLAKHMITFFNELRKEHRFTHAEYEKINQWSNIVWSEAYKRTELKQYCSNCYKDIYYYPRYPKSICGDCYKKDKFDKEGNLLDFANQGVGGGLRILYMDRNGNTIKKDDSQVSCDCTIDGKLFFAEEARFGGIVIQKKDQ